MEITNKFNGKNGTMLIIEGGKTITTLKYFFRKSYDKHVLETFEIEHLDTIKEYRCRGYASKILDNFIKEFGSEYTIILDCYPFELKGDWNNFRIRQKELFCFYNKFGFEHCKNFRRIGLGCNSEYGIYMVREIK